MVPDRNRQAVADLVEEAKSLRSPEGAQPSRDTLKALRAWLRDAGKIVIDNGLAWHAPHVSVGIDGEIVLNFS